MALSQRGRFPGESEASHPKEDVGSNGELPPRLPGRNQSSTAESRDGLGGSAAPASGFRLRKLEEEAQKNWDLFYKRNTTNFFKDRHWTTREFQELQACREVQPAMFFQHASSSLAQMSLLPNVILKHVLFYTILCLYAKRTFIFDTF